ncbi:MAG: Rrf2 family transcriptional regulator [Oscillospiraceae bacterium]|nr:Rrf2 family transcriptional regulator [Oscillospiraceae bacterium]
MLVSTKGRYALRVMADLASQKSNGFIPLTEVAQRQDISEKYLESIVSSLSRSGLLDSVRGKGGGYKLNRRPAEYSVADILKATEGSYAPVSCLENPNKICPRKDSCPTLKMWTELDRMIDRFFKGVSVQDLLDGTIGEI